MSDDQLPPALSDFGRQLDELGEMDHRAALRRRGSGRGRGLRMLPGAVMAAVLAAAVAAGATVALDNDGPVLPSPKESGGVVAPSDPSVIAATTVPDPDGGLPWVLRVFTNAQGEECIIVGRLERGSFGQVQAGRFRRLPPDTPGLCGDASKEGLVAFLDSRPDPPRTAVFGLSAQRQPVDVTVDGQTRQVAPAAFGAFLVVVKKSGRGTASARVATRFDRRVVTRQLGRAP